MRGGRLLPRRPREPGEAKRRRWRAERYAIQTIVVEGGSVLQEFARYRRSVQRLHALGPAVKEGVAGRYALE